MRTLAPLLALLLISTPAAAQDCDCRNDDYARYPTGGFLGGSLALAATQGEFSHYVDGGAGFDLSYLHRLHRDGWLAIRVDAGALIYGYETQRVPLSNSIGGRILVDLNTTNSIAFVGIGPQLGLPDGRLTPYANAFVGWSYLWTGSSVRGRWHDEPFAETTHFSDGAFSYGAGGGLYIPLRRGPSPISLDLGLRYAKSGRAEYLRSGDIQDNDDGSITLFPVESETDLLTVRLGIKVGISR